MNPAEALIQRQLDAYNARNLADLLACYAPDAEQLTLQGELLAKGHDAMRDRFAVRFAEPNLRATLCQRMVLGSVVVDHEVIRRTFAQGPGTVEMLCIYEIAEGLIQRARFAAGPEQLDTP